LSASLQARPADLDEKEMIHVTNVNIYKTWIKLCLFLLIVWHWKKS